MKFIIYVLQFYTSLKVLEVSFSRSWYWWCDKDDRYHHFLFGKFHPKVWESQLKYPILKGYHPKRMYCMDKEGYTCISFRLCPCINSFDMLWLYLVVCLCFHFSMFLFPSLFCTCCFCWSYFSCSVLKCVEDRKSVV